MRLAALIVILSATSASAQGLPRPVVAGIYAAHAADAALSHYNLTRGGRELVVPSQNPHVVAAAVMAEALVLHQLLDRAARRGSKRAKWLGLAVIASRVAIVSWNYRQVRRLR